MKIIHCADLHLNSPLNSNFSLEKSKTRKDEITNSFYRLVDYATANQVDVVLVVGDLFDSAKISQKLVKNILEKIGSAQDVKFLYVRGNHDESFCFNLELPENLYVFDEGYDVYEFENLSIGSFSHPSEDMLKSFSKMNFKKDNFNILAMHTSVSGSYGDFSVKIDDFSGRNIDYIALGHFHTFTSAILDKRGVYSYCGTLDGRGFDEPGKKGFVLIDTDEKKYEFVEFSSRVIFDITIDITDVTSTVDLIELIKENTEQTTQEDIVRITFVGAKDITIDVSLISKNFEDEFFYFTIRDNSVQRIDFREYENDISLKGEFIRLVNSSDMSDKQKSDVITACINAFNSEVPLL